MDVEVPGEKQPYVQGAQKQCGTFLGNRGLAACADRRDSQFAFTAKHALAILGLMLFLPYREINISETLLPKYCCCLNL